MNKWFIVFGIILLLTYIPPRPKVSKESMITLIRQAARWAAAAQQDKSPMIALLHANYGAGYLWALKDIASDQDIYNATGIDVVQFKKKIIDIQDAATTRVSKQCPQFFGDIDQYLLKIGGDL